MSYFPRVKVEPGTLPIQVEGIVQVEPGVNPLDVVGSVEVNGSTVIVEPGNDPLNTVIEPGVNPIPVSIDPTDSIKVEPGITPVNVILTSINNTSLNDAFGRLRVTMPATLFDGKTLNDTAPLKFDDQSVSGSGTSTTFNTNQSSVTLAVSNATAGRRIRQSFQRFNYLPGKSHLILMTFVLGTPNTAIKKSVGYYNDKNGIILRLNGTVVEVVRRTFTSGSAVDNSVVQADWNVDPLDGTGPSGVTIDFTKTQILVIDLEWLGVGRVRCGVNIDGVTYYFHQFSNANVLSVPYMGSPNLPVRYEIENTGAGVADSLTCICATVMSEGGQDPIGTPFGVANAALRTGINGSGATRYGLLGLRLKSTHIDQSVVIPTLLSIIGTTANDAFAWELVLNPTVAGTPTWNGVTNSSIEWFDGTSANTVTGGTILLNGVAISQTSGVQVSPLDNVQPGANIAGTPQEFVLVIRPYTNMSAIAGMSWRELS